MVQVADILPEVKQIIGNDDDEFVFRRLTDAVELLANKGDWDPLLGVLDISAHNQVITLPPEVEVPLGINVCGRPALLRDQMFRFHLNGLGDLKQRLHGSLRPEVEDLGDHCIYRELPCPSKLIAYCSKSSDVGADFWVEGFDQNGDVIRTLVGDTWVNGWKVPVVAAYPSLPTDAPIFSRITRIRKAETDGTIRLSTLDLSSMTGVLLGVYQWNQTDPVLRRIRLSTLPRRSNGRQSCNCDWVRIFFRRHTFKITSDTDFIPLHNRQAVIMAVRALKSYSEPGGMAEGEAQEATAVRWLAEEQHTSTPATVQPIQVWNDADGLNDKYDYID